MDVFDIDGVKALVLGMLGFGGVQLGKGVVMAQRERDKSVTAMKEDIAAYKLHVSQEYSTKSELARIHDRIDKIPHEVAELLRRP